MRAISRVIAVALLASLVALPARAGAGASRIDGFSGSFRQGNIQGQVFAYRVTGGSYDVGGVPVTAQDVVSVCVIANQKAKYYYPGGVIEYYRPVEFACGPLTLTLADDLASATAKGSIRSFITGQKMKVTIAVKQAGDLVPFVSSTGAHENFISADQNFGELLAQHGYAAGSAGLNRKGRMDVTLRSIFVRTKATGGPATLFRYASAWASI